MRDGYTDIYSDESNLDGWFTAKELRQIADEMDKKLIEINK